MRFANLSLERYGHFEDCQLTFRAGPPDLHVIYGPNEAGKTTSMAAVSDLLFGFPARSPYNFIYDYSLLRVGAVLEDDGKSLALRRKKGTGVTLLDADDRPLDEGALLAMLRGQTRETFGLSFSLNQEGLREGGRAMVEARNDLGRALFAAGSGLTGVSDELSKLESEADAIWGPRASARRSFTLAQRDFETHSRAVRDQSLKPKAWLDAKSAVAAKQEDLTKAQRARDDVLAQLSRIERIRRIAPSIRLRADHLNALEEHAATIAISPHREAAAERAIADADAAGRAKATAEKLLAEAVEKIGVLDTDPLILAEAERIDELVTAAGAASKARNDQVRLEGELATAAGLVERLREETETIGNPPTRIASSRLRELALQHVEDMSARRQIDESEEDLALRRASVKAEGKEAAGDLSAIIAAVDAARALGADADLRCVSAQRDAELAASSLQQALARLAPWAGDAQTLFALPNITRAEIEEARVALGDIATEIAREIENATRARQEAAKLSLEMEQLSSGTAISAEEIAASRAARNEQWQPLRAHILAAAPLPSPEHSVMAFEATITEADERSDLRFAAADESSRLADMAQRRAKLHLEADQGDARSLAAAKRAEMISTAWQQKLISSGYPAMDPARFLGWLADRDKVEAAAQHATLTTDAAKDIIARRGAARAELVKCLGTREGMTVGAELAPVLAVAEQIRSEGEKAAQRKQLEKAAAMQIERDAEALGRRRKRLEDAAATRAEQWNLLLTEAGLKLEIAGATATLDALDELRAAIARQSELQARIEGAAQEARDFEKEVTAVADALGIAPTIDVADRLNLICARLTSARAAGNVAEALKETIASRTAEISAETAKIDVAMEALLPLMKETASTALGELSGAIERSRRARALRDAVTELELTITAAGDGKSLAELLDAVGEVDIDSLAAKTQTTTAELAERNEEVAAAAAAHGDARRVFASLETDADPAADAASNAEQARAELGVLSDQFILKRAQAVTLRWAIEKYRERHQDPMLLRAGEIFSTLTTGRYAALRIDADGATPRLLGLRDDGRTVVEIGAMSEGTADQLFLALRLAAVEQSVVAGVRLPFLADDLFVNFDDRRSEAGFQVLAELARSTQVLFFTHHPHLAAIARSVVGEAIHSECSLT
ncbi:AAA family ATPase [Sphingomonadaceae bacterium G21617-S1]|jgi:uncharacterized protein YhaN|uniref:Uncharacterized protein YhaN n=3 Tax=Sphingomonadaceae TaxID=41297 RepID=A0A7W6BN28_9SPHN|nr:MULTISPECIES: YhaN family protein [Sphingomonadaceae]MCZ4344302.1 AAA family ATPase [Sphingomonadaceae bacterium G21617-S1]AJR26625.1 chromosome partition protein smc [Sphingobium sp. YBL2]API61465.1 chromosome segregation protein SMC [Tardibacter chloracetimidivorans]KEZ11960.1 Chromosome partition protein smc [Sphingobium yanoikuyae]MBB3928894.1 uncharacterized protein YhaN [Sphingobium jiangsuense]